MPVPGIVVQLTPGTGATPVNLEGILSQETGATLSSLIEDPTGLNNFTTGDVSLKGYDAPNGTTVPGYFAAMTGTSTDYLVTVVLQISPGVSDVVFSGYVAPNTVQFEPRTGAFSFTVFGVARNLQTTSAAGLFQRPGYPAFPSTGFVAGYDNKWCLYSDATSVSVASWPPIQVSLVAGGGSTTCDFYAGDQIQLGTNETLTIVSVTPDTASPPAFWSLGLLVPLKNDYAAGTVVHLLTPYQRSLKLEDVVGTLFTAAGFPTEYYFFSAPLPNSSTLFTSSMETTGLPGGSGVGIAAVVETGGAQIAVSGPSGVYTAPDATSGFTLLNGAAGFRQPPIDATNYGTAVTMFGVKRSRTRVGSPRYGLNVTMIFYGYDHLAGNKRYVMTVTCNADVAPGSPLTITTELATETCTSGVWVWGSHTPIAGIGINTTTSTDLNALYDAIGIDVDPATGTVFFTDIQLTGAAGSPVTMNTSSYQPGGAGYVAARQAALNGPIVFTASGRCVVFMVDGILGASSTAYLFTVNAAGVMTSAAISVISPYIIGRSLKKNAGDGRFYGLISDPAQGLLLASWASDSLTPNPSYPPAKIAAASNVPAQGAPLSSGRPPFDVDLAIQYGVSLGTGVPCPMYALIGGTPVFISNKGSGRIEYADMTGLSVADALQQLSVLIAGIFYLSPSGPTNVWSFRSRSTPAALTIATGVVGASDQIDGDSGFINLVVQPVSNKWVGYVSVTNENNAAIFGDTSDIAGSIAYASANTLSGASSYSLELTCRFVDSSPYAIALAHSLYNYLGAQKRQIEVNRIRDGRLYWIGRTFHCNVDGLNRQFQIIETDHPICSVTVKVVGLEV